MVSAYANPVRYGGGQLWACRLRSRRQDGRQCRVGLRVIRATAVRMQLQPGIRPCAVLGLWGKNTMPYAGTMAFYRDYRNH